MFCAAYTLTSAMALFESYNIIPLLLREDSHYSYAGKRSFVTDLGHFKCLSGVLISPLRTVSEFWASVPLESNRHWQPNSVQTHRASTVTAVMLDGALSLSLSLSFRLSFFSLSLAAFTPVLFSPTHCQKHTLTTDLCSRPSHPACREKRCGSVLALIQSVFIYVITVASNAKLPLSFLSSQKSPYSAERDWKWDVCQFALGEKRKLLKNPSHLPLTSCLRHSR